MQEKQYELERQLEEQQNLVKRMSEQMERALQQQQMEQHPPQQQLHPPPQQSARRQWNVAPPSFQQPHSSLMFASVDNGDSITTHQHHRQQNQQQYQQQQPSTYMTVSNDPSEADVVFQQEFQKAYAESAMGHHQDEIPEQSSVRTAATAATAAASILMAEGLPPRPTLSSAPFRQPRPVDPAFVSRPKIMNSLDERQLREEIDGVPTEHDAVREFDVHYDEYGKNILEESLSGRSKLVQMKESSTMHTWNDGPLVAKSERGGALGGETSAAAGGLPPRPMSGSPTRRSANLRKSGPRRSRNWDVEKSLASSSKLIFMKGSLPSIDERHPTGRPGTGGSLKSIAPAAPTIAEVSSEQEKGKSFSLESAKSSKHSSNNLVVSPPAPKEETVSDLPSIAWDENAPPANHPMGEAEIPAPTPPKKMSQPSKKMTIITTNDDDESSSPAMKVVADFLGVDPTSPHAVVGNVNQDLEQQQPQPPQTPPRNEFGNSPSQFRVHTPTHEERRAMERTVVGDLLGERTLGSTMDSAIEEETADVDDDDFDDTAMGKDTMKYVQKMNLANVDGGSVVLDETTDKKKMRNTFGQTKQWDTLEAIAL